MTARELLAAAARLREDVPLAPLTTYRFGGPARYLVEAETEEDLVAAARLAAEEHLPVFVLGRGSNVVVSDRGFAGVVIRQGTGFARRTMDRGGVISAGAAVPLPVLAREAARAGRGGLEFFVGIPGSVGGAVRMNAGCHGTDTAEHLISADIFDLGSCALSVRSLTDLGLSHRHSALTDGQVVCFARFRTEPGSTQGGRVIMREISAWRKDNQPGGTFNAGSIFKNPPGDHAGRIIDALSLKGTRVGGATVSHRHANFFVAGPGATASDLFDLVRLVRDRVLAATGIELVPEVRFVGDFGGEERRQG